ncbi:MAG: phosphate acyltransferase PlsX [Rubrobacteraceae bacterium]
MRIAIDALGGDNAPAEIVAGAVAAAKRLPEDEVFLVGKRGLIEPLLASNALNVSVFDSGDAVGMEEEPAQALHSRPDASVAVAAKMIREGEADALFSAGNTGATVAAALLGVGRLKSCRRPAIATVIPLPNPLLLLDVGATVACRPQDLLNFAILGGVFAKAYFDLDGKARVGLLNIGEEPGKGTELTKEAHRLMSESDTVNFVGNVEGHALGGGVTDVLVTDGFTGNVVLKTAEGVARECLSMVRDAVKGGGVLDKMAAGILRTRLVSVRDQVDPENYGGSFLLGVNGSVVIGHGNSRARGTENALLGISRAGKGLAGDLEQALSGDRPSASGT